MTFLRCAAALFRFEVGTISRISKEILGLNGVRIVIFSNGEQPNIKRIVIRMYRITISLASCTSRLLRWSTRFFRIFLSVNPLVHGFFRRRDISLWHVHSCLNDARSKPDVQISHATTRCKFTYCMPFWNMNLRSGH